MIFCWDDAPGRNVEHVAEHGLTPGDVEHAFDNIIRPTKSRSSGRPALLGLTPDDRVIFVSYELDYDDDGEQFVYVITAYESGEK